MAELTGKEMIEIAKKNLTDLLDEYCDTWSLHLKWSYPTESTISNLDIDKSKILKHRELALTPDGVTEPLD